MRYAHPCKKCVPLGEYEEFDLYFRPSDVHDAPMVIARFGDHVDAYYSSYVGGQRASLSEASRRAITKGLYLPNDGEVVGFYSGESVLWDGAINRPRKLACGTRPMGYSIDRADCPDIDGYLSLEDATDQLVYLSELIQQSVTPSAVARGEFCAFEGRAEGVKALLDLIGKYVALGQKKGRKGAI